jgi:hypothetical protein
MEKTWVALDGLVAFGAVEGVWGATERKQLRSNLLSLELFGLGALFPRDGLICSVNWIAWASTYRSAPGVTLTQTVTLHGLGGVGKTQLAVEYAWKHLGGYKAVLWLRADSPEALDANLAGLAGLLGLPEASAKE